MMSPNNDTLRFIPAAEQPQTREFDQEDQLLLMQEMERQRIAMDLHDGLGPLITLIKLELQTVRALLLPRRCKVSLVQAAVRRAEENVARAFEELRRTVMDLRPSILDDLGILPALGWLIRQFELSGTDTIIEGNLMADERAIPAALKIVIYRVCQEALNNVVKHADASRGTVALVIVGDELLLSIEDDGRGFAATANDIANRSGGGLPGILRRAKSSNGSFHVDSSCGGGTRLTICWPLTRMFDSSPDEPSGSDTSRGPSVPH